MFCSVWLFSVSLAFCFSLFLSFEFVDVEVGMSPWAENVGPPSRLTVSSAWLGCPLCPRANMQNWKMRLRRLAMLRGNCPRKIEREMEIALLRFLLQM